MRKLISSLKSWLGLARKEGVDSTAVDNTAHAEGLTSPEGLGVIASVGGKKSERPNFFSNETIEFKEVGEPSLTFNNCGHRSSRSFEFNIWGNTHKCELKPERIKKVDGIETTDGLCPKCFFEKMRQVAIRCCLCGYAILQGDGVALYHKSSRGINKKVATYVGDSAVGCLLWDCCPSGGFFAGHWTSEGFKSAFDGETAAEKAFSSGQMVIGNT